MKSYFRNLCQQWSSGSATSRRNRGRSWSVQSLEQRHMLAADFQLLRDINVQEISPDSNPEEMVAVGSTLYFTAETPQHGRELWKSDGTAAGTVMVRDINVGPGSSAPSSLVNLNGTLYFAADNGSQGRELWRSNGTAAGTVLVKDIRIGLGSAQVSSITPVNGMLYLRAGTDAAGYELWKSDGTAAGTVIVKDISPGAGSSLGETPHFTNVSGNLFFRAFTETHGYELWKSNGTAAGTVMVQDLYPGPASGLADASMENVAGHLFFNGIDIQHGTELWKTDGSVAGTVRITDMPGNDPFTAGMQGKLGLYVHSMFSVDGKLVFTATIGVGDGAQSGLWTSDGTEAGTVLLPTELSFQHSFVFVQDEGLYFIDSGLFGGRISVTDGTVIGTRVAYDLSEQLFLNLGNLTTVGDSLFFTATAGSFGHSIWRARRGGATVEILPDITQFSRTNPEQLINVGGTLFFSAYDQQNGRELWRNVETENGTILVKNIGGAPQGSNAGQATNVNGTLYFTANDGITGHELWKSDGTTGGTVLVKNLRGDGFVYGVGYGPFGSNPESLTNVNGVLYFTANDGTNGYELWKSDGTAAGTVMVKNIRSGAAGSDPYSLVNVNGTLFFTADNGVNGRELWKSNGTAAGTVLVKDIAPGGDYSVSYYTKLTNVNGVLYFAANDGTNGYELWKSNGTSAGTTLVKNIASGDGSSLNVGSEMVNVSGRLFFVANDNVNGYQLWKSDGTSAGTSMVSMNAGVSYPHSLTNFAGNLFFSGLSGVGRELWRSDGTTSGTTLVADINTFSGGSSNPSDFTNVNGLLYFTANNGLTGTELWKTDGTSSGTTLVRNIASGGLSSSPYGLTNANGVLYFTASDGANGRELWTSNGFFSGTTMVKQFRSGPSDSWPEPVVVVNNLLYVSADSDAFGREMFVANLTKGTSGNDAFTLRYSGTGQAATVTVTLSINSGPSSTLGTFPVAFALPIDGLGGNDSVLIEGTPGNDVFAVDSSGRITVNSAHVVLSSIETRTFSGGAGNDTYRFDADGSIGSFQIRDTAGGTDTIDLSPTSLGVTLYLDRTSLQTVNANLRLNIIAGSIIENANGGTGDDIITGNAANNTLLGNAGNDRLNGLGGNDSLIGGSGNDTYIFTNAATSESDTITEVANAGTDTIDFSGVTTPLTISLSTSATQAVHTRRTLRLNSAANFENLIGGSSHDTLTGNAANNTLIGNAGNDRLNGLGGNDSLIGGSGNDTYIFTNAATSESDTITEGANAGTDTIDFSGVTTPLTISLSTSASQAVHTRRTLRLNSAANFENLIGGSSHDTLTGNAANNTLIGNAGNDRLNGLGGNDSHIGGAGNDTYIFTNAATSESDTITEGANAGTDTIDFSALSAAITLNMGSALVQGVHANRTLRLNGASAIENATGGRGNDLVIGNAAANALHGNAGHDILIGRSGNDVLTGGSGRNILIGGLGSDILTGGEHDDILIGGYTLYDTLVPNLTNLREAWLSNQSYASRVDRLRTGTGVPITSLKAGLTVRNDEAAVDRLRGGIGSDWYFRALDDLLLDFATGELADLL